MGLQKIILCSGPSEAPTAEERKRVEEALEIYHKYGSVSFVHENGFICIENPEDTEKRNITENLKQGRSVLLDYQGGIPFNEFINRR